MGEAKDPYQKKSVFGNRSLTTDGRSVQSLTVHHNMHNTPQSLDLDSNYYLSVSFSRETSAFSRPSSLANLHPLLKYEGPVGSLADIHLYSIPKSYKVQEVVTSLKGVSGVIRVDLVQTTRKRKREES